MTTIIANPTEFQGYPVDLLAGLKGMGRKLIDNDALFAAVQAYTDATVAGSGGSALGPALLTADCTVTVTSTTAHQVPEHVGAKPVPVVADSTVASWDTYDLDALLAKVSAHKVEVHGRVKTPGKLIAALEAAGVQP